MFRYSNRRCITFQMILLTCASFLTPTETVKIEELIVPEVLQVGNSSDAVLDCRYSGVSDQVTVQWLYNGSETPVYQWTPHSEPVVDGILKERLDLTYKASSVASEERRAIRIVALDPQLSGHYTCRVLDQLAEARQTKAMLVFSPEKEFLLEFEKKVKKVEIKCTARGIYPQPELVLEHKGMLFPKQQQRIWRSEGVLFDVESRAELPIHTLNAVAMEQVTCRLQLPQAGYTAIKKELLHFGPDCNNCSSQMTFSTAMAMILIIINS